MEIGYCCLMSKMFNVQLSTSLTGFLLKKVSIFSCLFRFCILILRDKKTLLVKLKRCSYSTFHPVVTTDKHTIF